MSDDSKPRGPFVPADRVESLLDSYMALLASHRACLAYLDDLSTSLRAMKVAEAIVAAGPAKQAIAQKRKNLDALEGDCRGWQEWLKDFRRLDEAIAVAGIAPDFREDVRH